MLSNKKISLMVGVGLAAIFLILAPKSWEVIGDIQERQISSNLRLAEWKDAYQALLPVNDRWAKVYPDGRKAKDVVSLYRLIDLKRHKLISDIDKISQSASSDVLVNGVNVGLQRLCVVSDGGVMSLTASSVGELRSGLRGLSERADIDMGEIVFSFDKVKSQPVANISGLCLKVRVDGSAVGGV